VYRPEDRGDETAIAKRLRTIDDALGKTSRGD